MSIEYEIDPEELFLLERWLSQMKTELDIRKLCQEAWEDFNKACDEGRAIEWLNLDPEENDLDLERYMLERFIEMRKENQKLKQKVDTLRKIIEEQ